MTSVGIAEVTNASINISYSNEELKIKFSKQPDNARIRIYDPIGKLLLNTNFHSGKVFTRKLKNVAQEFILVNVEEDDQMFSKKILVR